MGSHACLPHAQNASSEHTPLFTTCQAVRGLKDGDFARIKVLHLDSPQARVITLKVGAASLVHVWPRGSTPGAILTTLLLASIGPGSNASGQTYQFICMHDLSMCGPQLDLLYWPTWGLRLNKQTCVWERFTVTKPEEVVASS